jgi:hypothetical protein
MTPVDENVLRGALMIGEAHGEQAIKLAFELRDLRRSMWHAIHQLKSGKTSEARKTLERALADDHRRSRN